MARKKPQVFGTRGIFVANCNENQIKMLSFVMFLYNPLLPGVSSGGFYIILCCPTRRDA